MNTIENGACFSGCDHLCMHKVLNHGEDCDECNRKCFCGHLNGRHAWSDVDSCTEENCECEGFDEDRPTIEVVEPKKRAIAQFPHCDARILHAPGECKFCDMHPDWQELRTVWGINFTGHHEFDKYMCPAEQARSIDTINRWHGNVAEPEWPVSEIKY